MVKNHKIRPCTKIIMCSNKVLIKYSFINHQIYLRLYVSAIKIGENECVDQTILEHEIIIAKIHSTYNFFYKN